MKEHIIPAIITFVVGVFTMWTAWRNGYEEGFKEGEDAAFSAVKALGTLNQGTARTKPEGTDQGVRSRFDEDRSHIFRDCTLATDGQTHPSSIGKCHCGGWLAKQDGSVIWKCECGATY